MNIWLYQKYRYLCASVETLDWIDMSHWTQQTFNKAIIQFFLDWRHIHQNDMFFFLWETLCQNSLTPPTQEKMHKFMYNGLSVGYLEITETINQLKLNWRVVFT